MSKELILGEAAYLLLLARRALNFAKEAKERGEEYHDLTPFTRLQCGLKARLHFVEQLNGAAPVVELVCTAHTHSPAEMQDIAGEIAGVPMILSECKIADRFTFTRKIP